MKTLKQTLNEMEFNMTVNYFRNGQFIMDTSELKMNWKVKKIEITRTPWGNECNIYC